MPYSNISSSLTAVDKTNIGSRIDAVKLVLNFLVNLTPEERKKFFKMGDKSVAFVQKALQAAQANPTVIPATFNVTEFAKDVQLFADLGDIKNWLNPLMEGVDDTMLALGSEMMQTGVAVYKLIKDASKTNAALGSTADDLGERFKKVKAQAPVVTIIQPQSIFTLSGVVPTRQVKNLGDGTLEIFKGIAAAGQKKTVGGKSAIKLPSDWTTITISNPDSAKVGVCSVGQR